MMARNKRSLKSAVSEQIAQQRLGHASEHRWPEGVGHLDGEQRVLHGRN
jgi:hypothetical protein